MNKRKIITLLAALTLVGAVGVGATLAYFTDNEAATNVITMGHVDVELDEPNFDTEDGEDDKTIEDILPGETIVKDPTITVGKDSKDAYIRAKIEFTGLDDNQQVELLNNINVDTTVWYLAEDGYYYYNAMVKAGSKVVLFDEVVIPQEWGNEVANLKFEINVSAEAIQADNFTPVEKDGMIVAWTYADGTAITVENYVENNSTVSSGDL